MYLCILTYCVDTMKKLLKIILVILGCLAALVLLAMLLGSLFGGCATKNYVNNHSYDLIGRQAHVEHVGVNLFTGRVAIHELNVKEDDGETWFASFDTLDVSVSLLRLLGQRVQVRHLTLVGLDAHIIQEVGIAVNERPRFPGAGAGHDTHGPFRHTDGVLLLPGQGGELNG